MSFNSENGEFIHEGELTFRSDPHGPHEVVHRAFEIDDATVKHLEQFFRSPHFESSHGHWDFAAAHVV
jgi:hypothetical protein